MITTPTIGKDVKALTVTVKAKNTDPARRRTYDEFVNTIGSLSKSKRLLVCTMMYQTLVCHQDAYDATSSRSTSVRHLRRCGAARLPADGGVAGRPAARAALGGRRPEVRAGPAEPPRDREEGQRRLLAEGFGYVEEGQEAEAEGQVPSDGPQGDATRSGPRRRACRCGRPSAARRSWSGSRAPMTPRPACRSRSPSTRPERQSSYDRTGPRELGRTVPDRLRLGEHVGRVEPRRDVGDAPAGRRRPAPRARRRRCR